MPSTAGRQTQDALPGDGATQPTEAIDGAQGIDKARIFGGGRETTFLIDQPIPNVAIVGFDGIFGQHGRSLVFVGDIRTFRRQPQHTDIGVLRNDEQPPVGRKVFVAFRFR